MRKYTRKLLDTADIVREAIFRQLSAAVYAMCAESTREPDVPSMCCPARTTLTSCWRACRIWPPWREVSTTPSRISAPPPKCDNRKNAGPEPRMKCSLHRFPLIGNVRSLTCSSFASMVCWSSMYPVTLRTTLPRDDEASRLFAVYEACRAKEHSIASQFLCPGRSLPHDTYMKLVSDLMIVRTECNEKMLAVRAHHNKTEEKRRSA
jgi:hypothetical protein